MKHPVPATALLALTLGLARPAAAAEHLRGEASAFLQANAASPVDWMPWGTAAVERARREQRPVFLFVGSFTSELARAMTRQTFANPDAAAWLNKYFICVIADREEHPEVASLFGAYVADIKQLGGWPLNVWLTPEFVPYEGAAYLGPSEDWGRPGFLKLANQAKSAWDTSPAACRRRAQEAAAQLAPAAHGAAHAWSDERTRARLKASTAAWMAAVDAAHGGFGDPPKYPEPELLRFLLRQGGAEREAAAGTLRTMASSALRDPLDGGFYHYASDAAWRLPYPQKLLSDQARVALAYLEAAQGADAPAFEGAARSALDYALARLAHGDGTFAAAEDASGDENIPFFTWKAADIDAALGADADAFKKDHGVDAAGNVPASDDPSGSFAGRNILRSAAAEPEPAAAARLLAVRGRRPQPPRDERATAQAHGLLLSALSRAASQLKEPRYLAAARLAALAARRAYVLGDGGDLRHLPGTALAGAPADFAGLALGLRDYARAADDPQAGALADRLLRRLGSVFIDPVNGRCFATADVPTPGLCVRPGADSQPPAAEALAIEAAVPGYGQVAAALSDALDESNVQAPGDQLLSLQGVLSAGAGK